MILDASGQALRRAIGFGGGLTPERAVKHEELVHAIGWTTARIEDYEMEELRDPREFK